MFELEPGGSIGFVRSKKGPESLDYGIRALNPERPNMHDAAVEFVSHVPR
jgi:hypothetical protein